MQMARMQHSPGIANLILSGAKMSMGPDCNAVNVAMGYQCSMANDNGNFIAPMSYLGAIKAAEEVATKINPSLDGSGNSAFCGKAGQLFASWMSKTQTTRYDQVRAAELIEDVLRRTPPTPATIAKVYRGIWKKARELQGDNRVINERDMKIALSVENDPTCTFVFPPLATLQKFEMVKLFGNVLPFDILGTRDHQITWQALCILDDHRQENMPEDSDLTFANPNEIAQIWSRLDGEQIFAFYDALGSLDETATLSDGMAFLFTTIYRLTKGGNATEAHLAKRVEAMLKEYPQYTSLRRVSTEILSTFAQLFPTDDLTDDELYGCLIGMYTMVRTEDCKPMAWMIEQAAASNIAVGTAVADMICRYPNAPYARIADMIGLDQFTNWATLVCHLSYDRYCSLKSPPINMGQYPDLAFLGVFVSFMAGNIGNAGTNYRGTPDMRAKLSRATLVNIGTMILQSRNVEVEEMMSLKRDMADLHPGHTVVEHEGEYFLIPNPLQQGGAAQQPADPNAQAAQVHQDFQEALNRAERVGWPRVLRNAPPGTVKLTRHEATQIINAAQDNNAQQPNAAGNARGAQVPVVPVRRGLFNPRHLLTLATQLSNVARQEVIDPIDFEQNLNPSQRRRKLHEDITAAARGLNVTILPAWTHDPIPVPVIAPVDETRFNKYSRTWHYIEAINHGEAVLRGLNVNPAGVGGAILLQGGGNPGPIQPQGQLGVPNLPPAPNVVNPPVNNAANQGGLGPNDPNGLAMNMGAALQRMNLPANEPDDDADV